MGCKQCCLGCMQKIPVRNYIVFMVFLTTYINYSTRSNFSVSLPAMVSLGKKGENVPECRKGENITAGGDAANEDTGTKYEWDQYVQGNLLGAYFYGYLIGSLPAGIVSEYFGPFKAIFWSTLVAGIFNSACVYAAELSWIALFVARFIIGLAGGLIYPALQCLIGRWSPPDERGKFVSALMGNTIGTCLSWIIVGAVTKSYKWPAGYHVMTAQIVFFLIISFILLADTPESHPWITEEELTFIKTSQEGKVKKSKGIPPYKDIMLSFPFWTLAILHFGNLWGLYIQITGVPKYMKEYVGFDIRDSGILSSLPSLLRFFFGIGFGMLGDFFKRRKYKRILILKGFIVISHLIPGILMAFMGLVGCNSVIALVLLIFSMALNGAVVMTNLANPTDLAPNFAGTIFGIISFIGGTTGFIVPNITGAIISNLGNTTLAWSIVFALGGVIYFFCGVFFMLFGKAEVQPWNDKAAPQSEGEATPTT